MKITLPELKRLIHEAVAEAATQKPLVHRTIDDIIDAALLPNVPINKQYTTLTNLVSVTDKNLAGDNINITPAQLDRIARYCEHHRWWPLQLAIVNHRHVSRGTLEYLAVHGLSATVKAAADWRLSDD